MTIKLRERLFWGFSSVSAAALVAATLAAWSIGIADWKRAVEAGLTGDRPEYFYTVLGAAFACGLYAVIVLGFIAMRSGKTVSIEVFFFALWVFCQAFELAKVASVALGAGGAGSGAFELITRIALFGRYCGAIAVFAGSLFSVGLKQERTLPMFAMTVMVALFFASVHPLNSIGQGKDLLADRGVAALSRAFESSLVLMAAVDYFIGWRTGRDRAYLMAGLGIMACVAAAGILKTSFLPMVAVMAVPVLIFGTWLHLHSLHDYYLWR